MQTVARLASKISQSLSPSVAEIVQKTSSLSEAAAVLAKQQIADPLVWSTVLSLAENEQSVRTRSEISLQALAVGKYYHSRILRSLTADFSVFTSVREILGVLKIVDRLGLRNSAGIYLRASEKLQSMEIATISVSEISEIVHAFRRPPSDERLFAFLLKKIGKKISAAPISECVELLENMGRARIRELRTVHVLIDRVLSESEISCDFRLVIRLISAMDKLKIIHGRDRLLHKIEISDHQSLDLIDLLELAAALNSIAADTRKFVRFFVSDKSVNKSYSLASLPVCMATLRALCGPHGPALGSEQELSCLISGILSQTDRSLSEVDQRDCAELFLANCSLASLTDAWDLSALTVLSQAVQTLVQTGADRKLHMHVCHQRLRTKVHATVADLVDKQQALVPTAELLSVLLTRPTGKVAAKKRRVRADTKKKKTTTV